MIYEKPSSEITMAMASPPSTAAFHQFLRDKQVFSEDGEQLNEPVNEEDGEDGIDFIDALSENGDQEALVSARELLTTKVRLFGEDEAESSDEGDADRSDEEVEYELETGGENPAHMIATLRQQLKFVKKAYQHQVLSTMRIVKKLRSVHGENKRLNAIIAVERE